MNDAEFEKQRIVDSYEKRLKDLKRAYEIDKINNYGAEPS